MKLTVGAYPIYPDPSRPELGSTSDLLTRLSEDPRVAGWEIPYRGSGAPAYWDLSWPQGSKPDKHLVLTGIPVTMMSQDPELGFGLASRNELGRQAALRLNRELLQRVHMLTDQGYRVLAVQIHSAPSGGGSVEAFARSLSELVSWDWRGAVLAVEHCDAADGRVAPEKGFLSFAQELEAISQVYNASGSVADCAARARLGVSVNWARSVLETGSVDTPLQHLSAARAAGLLRGYMASGIDPADSAFGSAWVDGHLPVAGFGGDEGGSLLTPDRLRESWRVAGDDLVFKGFKMSVRPQSLTVFERLDIYRRVMDLLP